MKNAKIKILEDFLLNAKEQLEDGIVKGEQFKQYLAPFKHIIFNGMGGSILPAELFSDWFKNELKSRSFTVWQDYHLPQEIQKKSAVLCCSYSGNTQETISGFHAALRRKLPIIALTNNGKLEKLAHSYQLPLVSIPLSYAPRFAVHYFFGVFMGMFLSKQRCAALIKTSKLSSLSLAQTARWIAQKAKNRNLLVYTSHSLRSLAHFWEIAFDETAKTPTFFNTIPDSLHHDIVSFSYGKKNQKLLSIFLYDEAQQKPIMRKVFRMVYRLYKDQLQMPALLIESRQKNKISQLLFFTTLAHLASLKLAEQQKIDPLENTLQEKTKKEIEKIRKNRNSLSR